MRLLVFHLFFAPLWWNLFIVILGQTWKKKKKKNGGKKPQNVKKKKKKKKNETNKQTKNCWGYYFSHSHFSKLMKNNNCISHSHFSKLMKSNNCISHGFLQFLLRQTCSLHGFMLCVLYEAVLEPQVLPAFMITYFCNHCNINPTPRVIHQSM